MQNRLDAFQVIADPGRRQMLALLSAESMTINRLADNFDMSRPAVSKHVRILYEAGFISIRDAGRERHCTLKREGFDEIQKWMAFYDKFWSTKLMNLNELMNKKTKEEK